MLQASARPPLSGRSLSAVWAHPAFVGAVLLLLLNDWVFKAAFHNALTGKLSDLAGLFALPAFFAAFLPRRTALLCLLTGLLFVWWKLPLSQPLLDGLGGATGWTFYRVPDPTDLYCLLVLPLSWWCFRPAARKPRGGHVFYRLAGLLAIVTFCADSQPRSLRKQRDPDASFRLSKDILCPYPADTVLARLRAHCRALVPDSVIMEPVALEGGRPAPDSRRRDGASSFYNPAGQSTRLYRAGNEPEMRADKGSPLLLNGNELLYWRTVKPMRYRLYGLPLRSDTLYAMRFELRPELGESCMLHIEAVYLSRRQAGERVSEKHEERYALRLGRQAKRRLKDILWKR